MRPLFTIACLVLFLSCQGATGKQAMNVTESKKDTIQTQFFKNIVSQDSIKILDFVKRKNGSYDQERIVYIDYKFNNPDRKKLLTDKIENHKSEISNANTDSVKSNFVCKPKELKGTFIPVKKYKNDYCLYNFDTYFTRTMTDTSMIVCDMEGYSSLRFKNVKKEGRFTVYEFTKNIYNTVQIVAKTIDAKWSIQIWQKTVLSDDNKVMQSYELVIPTQKVSGIPILYTLTNDEEDEGFDKFDAMDLEKEFKK